MHKTFSISSRGVEKFFNTGYGMWQWAMQNRPEWFVFKKTDEETKSRKIANKLIEKFSVNSNEVGDSTTNANKN